MGLLFYLRFESILNLIGNLLMIFASRNYASDAEIELGGCHKWLTTQMGLYLVYVWLILGGGFFNAEKKEYCSWGCLPFNWQLQLHLQHIVRFTPAEYLQLWRRIFIGYHCPSRKARCSWCWLGGCQWTFSREVETSWTKVYPKSQIPLSISSFSVLAWYLHQPESIQLGFKKVGHSQTRPLDLTPGTPGSDKKLLKFKPESLYLDSY